VLPENSWKLDAIARLILSVLTCVFAGSLLATTIYVLGHHAPVFPSKFVAVAALSFICLGAALALLSKPWTWETFLLRAILAMAALYAGLAMAMWAESLAKRPIDSISTLQMIISVLSFQGAALLLIHHFLKESQTSWSKAFGFPRRWHMAVLWGLLIGVIFVEIGDVLAYASKTVMTHLPIPIQPEEQQAVQTIRRSASGLDRILLAVGTVFLVPFAEETLFRGILYPAIKQAGFRRLAVWITSLLFAAIHVNIVTFIPLFVLAVILTFLYEYTGNLLAPIIAHAVFNAVNFSKILLPT